MAIQLPPQLKIPRKNMGLKFILICALVVLMGIPAMFISYISYERAGRADDVTREVSARYGGPQVLMGPVLLAPYHILNSDGALMETGDYVRFADTGQAEFNSIETTLRQRSLFKVPTYQGQATLSASFAPIEPDAYHGGKVIDWDAAQIVMSISDVRGLKSDITLKDGVGKPHLFEPATALHNRAKLRFAHHKNYAEARGYQALMHGRLLSIPARSIFKDGEATNLSVELTLGGAQSLGVLPYARSTSAHIKADWADPGFSGAFPPTAREISDTGFSARWSVPTLARGIAGQGKVQDMSWSSLSEGVMRVDFVDTVSAYKTVNRSLKYAVLFIGLVFLAYFLFEVIVGVSVHPAQYVLIGLAQSIFYLLLLAFSEHIGFAAAFFIAATAVISATAGYAGAVFGGRSYIWRAGVVFSLVYGLLFALMGMQDFALMIGALASFIAVAATMYLTRRIDWYGKSAEA